ncbi:MAG: potassium channel family protein [Gemmatimonadetes bacterium]|nr:potassium channel family protein [Gemmatimonadota bacterium]
MRNHEGVKEPRDGQARRLTRERWRLLYRLERWLEVPMIVLGFAWLVLLVLELTGGLNGPLERLSLAIWGVFVTDFALRLFLAPERGAYLRRNWLTAVALAVPAFRVIRIVRVARVIRAARAARGVRLVKVVSSLNRGMRALGRSMGRRGLGYVLTLTVLVTLVGAAGMYAFERELAAEQGLRDFWSALWWTAMIMTSLGSEYWPRTLEGRLLGFLLAVYAMGVLGYITAALASFFVGRDVESKSGEVVRDDALQQLRLEIVALREEVRTLRRGSEP